MPARVSSTPLGASTVPLVTTTADGLGRGRHAAVVEDLAVGEDRGRPGLFEEGVESRRAVSAGLIGMMAWPCVPAHDRGAGQREDRSRSPQRRRSRLSARRAP